MKVLFLCSFFMRMAETTLREQNSSCKDENWQGRRGVIHKIAPFSSASFGKFSTSDESITHCRKKLDIPGKKPAFSEVRQHHRLLKAATYMPFDLFTGLY